MMHGPLATRGHGRCWRPAWAPVPVRRGPGRARRWGRPRPARCRRAGACSARGASASPGHRRGAGPAAGGQLQLANGPALGLAAGRDAEAGHGQHLLPGRDRGQHVLAGHGGGEGRGGHHRACPADVQDLQRLGQADVAHQHRDAQAAHGRQVAGCSRAARPRPPARPGRGAARPSGSRCCPARTRPRGRAGRGGMVAPRTRASRALISGQPLRAPGPAGRRRLGQAQHLLVAVRGTGRPCRRDGPGPAAAARPAR
jgi:hypothetical protein